MFRRGLPVGLVAVVAGFGLGALTPLAASATSSKVIRCKSTDLRPGGLSRLTAQNTSCQDARKTARAWRANLACASGHCTANGYRCRTVFFRGPGGSPAGHQTCTRRTRRVKFDYVT